MNDDLQLLTTLNLLHISRGNIDNDVAI